MCMRVSRHMTFSMCMSERFLDGIPGGSLSITKKKAHHDWFLDGMADSQLLAPSNEEDQRL